MTIKALESERERQEAEMERRHRQEMEREQEQERKWEKQIEMERTFESVSHAVRTLVSLYYNRKCNSEIYFSIQYWNCEIVLGLFISFISCVFLLSICFSKESRVSLSQFCDFVFSGGF